MNLPKYALLEIERKMLVEPSLLPPLDNLPASWIYDRYLQGGRLRLRRIEPEGDGAIQYKLCKKYGQVSRYQEPITNLYLTRVEYETLLALPGKDLVKRRCHYEWEGSCFGIDQFHGALCGLYLCEIEAPSIAALEAIAFPPFCVEDVTENATYSGAALAMW